MENSKDYKLIVEAELKKDQPDWELIEKISRGEVDADPLRVRFSVDAAHIQRLGIELVAKQETALVELIKNAYDAEAARVQVTFLDAEKPGGTLIIEDDGTGMSLEVIRDAWMRISTISKRDNPISENFGRVRAGRKGIGRFAVQRLGKQLVLETESIGSTEGLRVTFDWDNTFTDGKPLSDIFNNVERYIKPADSQLTRLTIVGLRENWTPASMQRAWKAILLLQPPFKLSKPTKKSTNIKADPGFEVTIDGITGRQQRTALSLESTFLDHAIAEIKGEIDTTGKVKFSITSTKLELNDIHTLDEKLYLTGPVQFSTKYFIYSSETLPGISLSMAQEMAKTYGGIRIYRNGFRVLPYGERYDDWLALDQDSGRRALLIPAANRNFFGHVEIDAILNPCFEETSSREGIIENEAFTELTFFVRSAIEWGAKRVAEARHRKVTAGQRNFVSTVPVRKPSEIITSLIDFSDSPPTDSSDNAEGSNNVRGISPEKLAAAQAEAVAWEDAIESKQAESLKYEEMLRILATLGLSITIFGHEIKGVRSSVAGNIVNLSRLADSLEVGQKQDLFKEGIGWMETATDRMFDLGGYIAGLMSSTESRELKSHSIKGVIERFMEQFSQYAKRQHIGFTAEIKQENLRTTEMHSSEIDSILLNLMTNSIKAIKKSKSPTRRIHISAFEDREQVVIRFEDNGTGVDPTIAHRIFDPFFTTTIGSEEDSVAGPGTGLGLKIISDISQSYGGSASLSEPSEGFNCCFEIRINAAQRQGNLYDI